MAENTFSLLESSPQPVFILDAELHSFLAVNQAAVNFYGWSREELLQRSLQELNIFDKYQSLLVTGSLTVRRKDGASLLVEVISSYPVNYCGKKAHLIMTRDLAANFTIDEQLRESESKYRRFFDSNMVGMLTWDIQGNILQANDRFLSMVGYTRDDLEHGRIRWNDMTPPEYRHLTANAFAEMREKGFCSSFEKEYIRKNGTRVPILIGGAFLVGSQEAGVCFVIDATERKRTERILLETERRLQIVVDAAPVILFGFDAKGIVTLSEGKGLEDIGVRPGQLVGENVHELHRDQPEVIAAVHKTLAGQAVRNEVLLGEQWLESVMLPLQGDNGEIVGAVGVSTVITQRRRIEDERRQLIEELYEALRVRDDFLSIASHELKTPLTTLRLQLSLIEQYVRGSSLTTRPTLPKLERVCDLANREFNRIQKLVNDLLDVTRIRAGRMELQLEQMDLCACVQDVVEKFTIEFEHPIYCVMPSPVVGHWDCFRIEQIIANLLSNALKYGGPQPVTVTVLRDSNRAILEVADLGIGIPESEQDRIFDRFERVPNGRAIGGLGLGLYISRQIAEDHEGTLTVRSEPGKGSNFILSLPILD